MKHLKQIVGRRLLWLTAVMMVAILVAALFIQILYTQTQAKENADAVLAQIRQVLEENSAELSEMTQKYEETCLLRAETVSFVITHDPTIIGNVEEFRRLAVKLQVDEIHIFDGNGRIFTGTHPEYFDYTFDSGEQMNFFKPMLADKSLRLCQEIMPNTAEGKLVQYSALWSEDHTYIIQIGMYPDAILEATEKNALSYIFSLLRGTPGVSLYAIDSTTGKIIGASSGDFNDKNITEIGINPAQLEKFKYGAHVTVNDVDSYCILKSAGQNTLIGYVIANDQLYSNIGSYSFMLALCLLVTAVVFVTVVNKLTDTYIISSISATNERLRIVADGNLEERVNVHTSREFTELSDHINSMIRALLSETKKISLVLNRTNLHIGVYEYHTNMKNVRYTEHIPEIFGVTAGEMEHLSADHKQFQAFIDRLRSNPLPDAVNTYRFLGKKEMFIKLEEVMNGNAVLGIVMDVTAETQSRMRAEIERDLDLMTGLYNRRGMERQFDTLFASPARLEHGALIVIDSDNLKTVNDTFGHAVGDTYLRSIADILREFRAPMHMAARVGGDEFVLLICGYPDDTAVEEALAYFRALEKNANIVLKDGTEFRIEFSYGYEMLHGRQDYEKMLSSAYAHMYNSKRIRKQERKTRTAEP